MAVLQSSKPVEVRLTNHAIERFCSRFPDSDLEASLTRSERLSHREATKHIGRGRKTVFPDVPLYDRVTGALFVGVNQGINKIVVVTVLRSEVYGGSGGGMAG